MLILRLKGGLGNQIFQIVHTLEMAKNNESLYVDLTHFSRTFAKDYAGSDFAISKLLKKDILDRFTFF